MCDLSPIDLVPAFEGYEPNFRPKFALAKSKTAPTQAILSHPFTPEIAELARREETG
jgi:hypothetical protein